MKIFVAIPEYSGRLPFNLVKCLLEEQLVAYRCGDELIVHMFDSNAGIADGRNHLADIFLKTDCEKMFFLDSDITFQNGAIISLAHKPVDFCGGAYRHKKDEESYPIMFTDAEHLISDKHGLAEVAALPTGFMCLSRKVYELFQEKHPERKDKNFGMKSFVYFQIPFIDGRLYGEDYYFCKEYREMGGKIYLVPDLELTHWTFHPKGHVGHVGNWLLKNTSSEQKQKYIDSKGI